MHALASSARKETALLSIMNADNPTSATDTIKFALYSTIEIASKQLALLLDTMHALPLLDRLGASSRPGTQSSSSSSLPAFLLLLLFDELPASEDSPRLLFKSRPALEGKADNTRSVALVHHRLGC